MSVSKKKPFQDVWIAGLDSARSQVIDGGMARIFFQLSAPPPFGWAYLFMQNWQAREYAMKCQAGTESGAIWIDCPPEDLQPFHMEQLESAVAQTNAKYRGRMQEQAINAIHQKELQLQLQSKLQNLGQVFDPVEHAPGTGQAPRSQIRNSLSRWIQILFVRRRS